ncbi:MAG TPA: YciI family protein [Usitatibacter sp.]|nr:YciI family protein [Usitatibacter sp.]
MKFLCLAYGDEAGWNSLTEAGKRDVLAADQAIRDRGNLMAAVRPQVRTVSHRDGNLVVSEEPYARHDLPLAGFSVIEAASVEEVIGLVSATPCARARGYVEIRPFWDTETP